MATPSPTPTTVGVGLKLDTHDSEFPVVVELTQQSSAERARDSVENKRVGVALNVGDTIYKVDDKDLRGKAAGWIKKECILGPVGSLIKFEFLSSTTGKIQTATLVRAATSRYFDDYDNHVNIRQELLAAKATIAELENSRDSSIDSAEVDRLRSQVRDLEDKVQAEQRHAATLDGQCSQLGSEKRSLQDTIDSMQSKTQSLQRQVDDLMASAGSASAAAVSTTPNPADVATLPPGGHQEAATDTANAVADGLREQIAQLKTQLSESNKKVAELQASASKAGAGSSGAGGGDAAGGSGGASDELVKELRSERDDLASQLQKIREEASSSGKIERDGFEAERARWSRERAELDEKVKQLQRHLDMERENSKAAGSAGGTLEATVNRLRGELDAMSQRHSEALRAEQDTIVKLERELSARKAVDLTVGANDAERSRLKADVTSLEANVRDLERQLARAKGAEEAATQRAGALEASERGARDAAEAAKTEAERAKRAQMVIQREFDSLREEFESEMAAAVRTAQVEMVNKQEAERNEFRGRMDAMQKEYSSSIQEAKETAQDNERLRIRNNTLQIEVVKKESELAHAVAAHQRLESLAGLEGGSKEALLHDQVKTLTRKLVVTEGQLVMSDKVDSMRGTGVNDNMVASGEALAQVQRKVSELQAALSRETALRLENESECTALQATSMAQQAELRKLRNTCADLKVKLADHGPEGTLREQELRLELKSAHVRITQLETDYGSQAIKANESAASIMKAKAELERQVSRLQSDINKLEEHSALLESQLSKSGGQGQYDSKVQSLEDTVHDLHARLAEAKVEAASAQASLAVIRAENAAERKDALEAATTGVASVAGGGGGGGGGGGFQSPNNTSNSFNHNQSFNQSIESDPGTMIHGVGWWRQKLADKDALINRLNGLIGSMEAQAKEVMTASKNRMAAAQSRYEQSTVLHDRDCSQLRADLRRLEGELTASQAAAASSGDTATRVYTEDLSRQLVQEIRRAQEAEADTMRVRVESKETISALRAELDAVRKQVPGFDGDVGDNDDDDAMAVDRDDPAFWRRTVELKDRQLRKSSATMSKLDEEVKSLREELKQTKDKAARQDSSPEMLAVRQQLRTLEKEKLVVESKLERAQDEMRHLRAQVSVFESGQQGGAPVEVQGQLRDAKIMVRALEQELRSAREAGTDKSASLEEMLKEEMSRRADLELAKESEIAELQAQVTTLELKCTLLRESESAATSELSRLRREFDDMDRRWVQQNTELDDMRVKEADLARHMAFLGLGGAVTSGELRERWQEMQDKQSETEATLETLRAESRRCREQEAWARGRLKSVEAEWDADKAIKDVKLASLQDENRALKEKLGDAIRRVDSYEQRMQAVNERSAIVERQATGERSLLQANMQLEREVSELRSLQTDLQTALRREKQSSIDTVSAANGRVAALQSQLERIADVERHQAESIERETVVGADRLSARVQDLESQVNALKVERDALLQEKRRAAARGVGGGGGNGGNGNDLSNLNALANLGSPIPMSPEDGEKSIYRTPTGMPSPYIGTSSIYGNTLATLANRNW